MIKVFLVICIILSGKVFSQGEWKQFLPEYNNIPYPSEVTVIKIDRLKNIWFGTLGYDNEYGKVGGLARFDGKVWKQYTKSNSLLPDGYITAIDFDLFNNAWIGMKDSGLAVIKNDTIKLIREPLQFIERGEVKNILVDKNGNIWVLYVYVRYPGRVYKPSALMKYDGKKWVNFNLDSLQIPEGSIHNIALDNHDNLFCGSQDKLIKFDGENWVNIDVPGTDRRLSVSYLAFDSRGILWVGTNGFGSVPTLLLYDNGTWKNTAEIYKGGEPSGIVFDNFGNTWISSMGSSGLAKYNGEKWVYFRRDNSAILWDQANAVAVDSAGLIWYGTPFGASTFDGEKWKYDRSSGGLPYEQVNKVLIDSDNNKWIAANCFGLVKFDGNTWQVFDKSNSDIPFNDINDIAIDAEHKIWVATGNGLGIFNGLTWYTYNEANTGYSIDNLWRIKIDSKGKAWFTSFDKSTLFSFDGTNWQYFNSTNSILPNSFIGRLGISPDDKICVGTNDGFFIYDGTNWTNYNVNNSPLPDNWVQCFAFDSTGNSWVGTANGVVRINNGVWEVFQPNNSGIVGWDVDDIAIDSKNNVLVGFYWDQGVSKYDGKNWKNFNHIFEPVALGGIDALSLDFDKYGNIWIGTLYQGLIEFNEDKLVSVHSVNNFSYKKQELEISVYPNPFNSQTNINFILPEAAIVGIKIYSITGELVFSRIDRQYPSGKNSFRFKSENLASGLYLCSFEITPTSKVNKQFYAKKLLLIK